jgi:hypothetical protein
MAASIPAVKVLKVERQPCWASHAETISKVEQGSL